MSRVSRIRSQNTLSQIDNVRQHGFPPQLWQPNRLLELQRADKFSMQELVDAYNQTRIDYIVPMPMNVSRLKEYIQLYDIDLTASWVAVKEETIHGLGMLGIRQDRAWITRVGVLPSGRRKGTGRAIIDRLLQSAAERELTTIWLEVIKGNDPAYQLFLTSGFQPTRELVVARRPPDPSTFSGNGNFNDGNIVRMVDLSRSAVFYQLDKRRSRPNWLIESESYHNLDNLQAILVECEDGAQGWVIYQPDKFQLKQIVIEALDGDPASVTCCLLRILHQRYSTQDAIMENLPAQDPTWPGFENAGYFDVFRRIEMVKNDHQY
jgi:ribosomal protein S18 acetylase RimI-like enzyme